MNASMSVSISTGNNSLSLLYKTAIEHINLALKPNFGANAIQNTSDSGVDVSPQATADRIVSTSTAFFGKTYELVQSGLKSFVDNSPRSEGQPKNCSRLNRVAMR